MNQAQLAVLDVLNQANPECSKLVEDIGSFSYKMNNQTDEIIQKFQIFNPRLLQKVGDL
ncbi:hypothetical protein [Anabaena subtropica]|uniref:Uncharacterized protein n=1 Tax=Anabaena subtropica FACHB-260 TaxID=2692884 RepID=A0ABR8CKV0_9NOST|nr:hypothetical protein [Anabaena subtropica]MBD2343391.1 hypothetical protein [Anabaena subtropica FACHB-260]